MKRLAVFALMLFAAIDVAPARETPKKPPAPNLAGTWTMKELIGGQLFTDIITITSSKNGVIVGTNEYGDPVGGYVYNNMVFISEVAEDIVRNAYYFYVTNPKSFARYEGTFAFDHDFNTLWYPLTVTRSSSKLVVPEFASSEEEARAKFAARQQQ
jgi:hypothetical protein